jgi:hypothetical protein
MTAVVYGTSPLKRSRRTRAEVEALESAIYVVVAAEQLRITKIAEASEREVLHRIAGGWEQ